MYKGMIGWEGVRVVGMGGQFKADPPCHKGTDIGAVFSVGDRDIRKPQDRSKWPLAGV